MFDWYFAAFSLKMCLVICGGGRQAVDHLGADLIWDLVLETVLLRTSNCISSVFPLHSCQFVSGVVLHIVCTLLLVSDRFIARLLGGAFTRLLTRWWWCIHCENFIAKVRENIFSWRLKDVVLQFASPEWFQIWCFNHWLGQSGEYERYTFVTEMCLCCENLKYKLVSNFTL